MNKDILEETIIDLGIKKDPVNVEEEVIEDDVLLDDDETVDEGDEELELDYHEFVPEELSKEDKKNHAFAELRRSNKEKEEELRRFENIAEAYGFKNYNEMVEQLENEALQKKAENENIDPKLYKRIHETEKELEKIKKQREEEQMFNRVNTVSRKIDDFLKDNGLGETHKVKLLKSLDADGFSLDDIYKIKNPNTLFSGYVATDVNEVKRQRELEALKRKGSLEEPKFEGDGSGSSYTMDDLINSLVKGKKENY